MNHETHWSDGDAGGLCWISDPNQAYVEAVFKGLSGNIATIETTGGITFEVDIQAPLQPPSRKQKEPPRRLLQRVPVTSNTGVGNMDDLSALHEASILSNIELRFRMDRIYTNSGPILIAMNPFKWLPIYGEEVIKQYHNRPYGSLEPHCFMEAEDAYQNLVKTRLNQAVVICGESGAGKTETTKLMLQYLSVISKRYEGGDAASGMTMGEKIVESNPLMEAFGNAKTLRNNNSSRFGKFTSLHYTQKHTISGCHITNLLLEKSRVVTTAEGERNYHIFYQIQTAKNLASFKISGDPNNETYTNQSGCTEVADMDDAEEYDLTIQSMKAVDISDAEIQTVMSVVAAIINIGNVRFTSSDPAQLDGSTSGILANACALLGVPVAAMQQALLTRVRELPGGEKVTTNNSQAESVSLRDAVSKSIYSKLFDWIVVRINKTLDVDPASNPQFIGILDIFGFEDMKVNGFEQLFINTTNEMLQKVFNDIIFKKEEEEYTREQIEWDKTVFPDNDPCIKLLTAKPIGLLKYLDSECQRGMAASEGADLVRKFNKSHNNDPFYEVCGPSTVWRRKDNTRTQAEDFLIHHYAGPIIYTVSEFIDKNRDALFSHVYDILAESTVPLIQDLYPPREDDVAASKMTVGNRFLGQLNQLVKMLRDSESRFVRCIKTNNTYAPAVVDKMSVLRQLVCSGVMAALEVRRAGFPSRMPYRDFVREFRVFTPRGVCRDDAELCGKMLHHPHVRERVSESSYRLGTTKLFMQADVLYTLQSIKNRIIYPFVRRLQIWWVKLQGDIMNRKLTRGFNLMTKLSNDAEVGGVQHVGFIVKAIADMREKHATASANLNAETIAALMKSCDSAEQYVAKGIAQKEEAYRIRAEILGVLDGYTSRLNAVKDTAATLYDERAKELLKGECEKAEIALNESRQEQMTAANSWDQAILSTASGGPGGLRRAATRANLNASASRANIAADPEEEKRAREERMEDAKAMVPALEELAARFLAEKAKMDAARAEYAEAMEQAADRLDTIPVEQFIIAGIKTVSDAVADSREAIYNAQKMLQSMDAEAFKASVKAATQSVEKAMQVAAHESARVQAIEQLDEAEKVLKDIQFKAQEDGLLETAGFDASITSAELAIQTGRDQCMIPDVAVLQAKTQDALSAVEATNDLYERAVEAKKRESKARFANRFAMFEGGGKAAPPPVTRRGGSGKGSGLGAKPLFKVRAPPAQEETAPAEKGPLFSGAKAPVYEAPAAATPPPAPVEAAAPAAAAAPSPAPAAAPAAAATPFTGSLEEWIDNNKMTKYKLNIMSLAAEINDLKEMTDEDVDDLVAECAIPKLAARRFKKALVELGAKINV